jgi:hypothetical protein
MGVEEIKLLFEYLQANNSLYVRLIADIEFFIALIIACIFSYFYYSILESFTRF